MATTPGHPLTRIVAIQAVFYVLLLNVASYVPHLSSIDEQLDGEFLWEALQWVILVGWILVPVVVVWTYQWLWELKGIVAFWRLVGISLVVNFFIGGGCWFGWVGSSLGAG